jgi:hypothetical protein
MRGHPAEYEWARGLLRDYPRWVRDAEYLRRRIREEEARAESGRSPSDYSVTAELGTRVQGSAREAEPIAYAVERIAALDARLAVLLGRIRPVEALVGYFRATDPGGLSPLLERWVEGESPVGLCATLHVERGTMETRRRRLAWELCRLLRLAGLPLTGSGG